MKKITIMLLLLFCIYSFNGCYNNTESHHINGNTSKEINVENTSDISSTMPETNIYMFDTYSDLLDALIKPDSVLKQESNDNGELFEKTLSNFESKKIDLFIPVINESVVALRNKEDYSNIVLFTSELYNLPWIFYNCKTDDCEVDIRIAYPNIIENNDINSATKYTEVLEILAPDAPNPNNYQNYTSYQKIYERKITLANGVCVDTMVSELKDNDKIYVMFVYNDMLVSVYAEAQTLTDTFWSGFDLIKY